MKVKELIERLQEYDGELPVVVDLIEDGTFTIADDEWDGVSQGHLGEKFNNKGCVWLSLDLLWSEEI